MTLREVEESTGVSNGYLSQLENDKIKKPSANTLYTLAELYCIDFDSLMVAAGFIDKKIPPSSERFIHIKVEREFEGEMLRYLDFLQHKLKSKKLSYEPVNPNDVITEKP